MNCQSTSEQPLEEMFIQINCDVKSIERGFRDWEGPDIINDCRGSAYFHSHTCKCSANIIVIIFIEI